MLGEPNSFVFGSIHDGVFEGKIVTDTHAYFVEHAKRYFPNQTHLDYGFHSIIYNERDVVDDPFSHKRTAGHANGCGINDEVQQWMESVQSAGVDVADDNNDDDDDDAANNNVKQEAIKANRLENKTLKSKQKQKLYRTNSIFADDDFKSPHLKYTKEANTDENANQHERKKRAARPKEDNRNTCSLYIQTDPLIWRHIREGIADVSISLRRI